MALSGSYLGRMQAGIRRYFLTGLLVIVPLGLTYYVVSAIVKVMDRILALLPPRFHPETYIRFGGPAGWRSGILPPR